MLHITYPTNNLASTFVHDIIITLWIFEESPECYTGTSVPDTKRHDLFCVRMVVKHCSSSVLKVVLTAASIESIIQRRDMAKLEFC